MNGTSCIMRRKVPLTLFHEGIHKATRYVIILIGDNVKKYELNTVEHQLSVFFVGNNNTLHMLSCDLT